MAWEPPEVAVATPAKGGWSPPEIAGWAPPEVTTDTGDFTIAPAMAAPTNAVVSEIPQQLRDEAAGNWTPEVIAAHNRRADEMSPPTQDALRERNTDAAMVPFFQEKSGPRRLTQSERWVRETPSITARESTPVADAWEKVKRTIFTTEQQKQEESIPITHPDGSVTFEYKPHADSLTRKGIFAPPDAFDLPPIAPDANDPAWKAALKGAANVGIGFTKFGMSPGGVAMLATGGAGGLARGAAGFAPAGLGVEGATAAQIANNLATAGRVASTGFAVDMLSHVPEQVKAATEATTTQGQVEGWVGALSTLAFGVGAAKHAITPGHPIIRETVQKAPEGALRAVADDAKMRAEASPEVIAQVDAEIGRRSAPATTAAVTEVTPPPIPSGRLGPPNPVAVEAEAAGAPATAAAVEASGRAIVPGVEGTQMPGFMRKPVAPEPLAAPAPEPVTPKPAAIADTTPTPETSVAGAAPLADTGAATGIATPVAAVTDVAAPNLRVLPDPEPLPSAGETMSAAWRAHQAAAKALREGREAGVTGKDMKALKRASEDAEGVLSSAERDYFIQGGEKGEQKTVVSKIQGKQKQGDLLLGSEPLKLETEAARNEPAKPAAKQPTVQETAITAIDAYGDAVSAYEHLSKQIEALQGDTKNKADVTRMKAAQRHITNALEMEHRREETAQLAEQESGKYELLESVKQLGKLPSNLSKHSKEAAGELKNIKESSRGATTSLFSKDAGSLDTLREALAERGFQFDDYHQMLDVIKEASTSGNPVLGSSFPEGYTGGPGAMGPVERAQYEAERKIFQSAQEPIQQRRVAEQRGDREEWLRRSDPDRMALAESIMELDAKAGEKLVDSINSGETKSATDIQELILVRELIDLHAARDAAAERLADPDIGITPTERAIFQKEWDAANERIGKTEDASDRTGSEKGAAFRMRRMMVADDYSLQGLSRRERKRLGRDLEKGEVDSLRKEAEAIKKAQAEADLAAEELRKHTEDAELDAKVDAYIKMRDAENAAQSGAGLPYHPDILARAEQIVQGIEAKRDELRAKFNWREFFGSESGAVGGIGGPKGEGKKLGSSKAAETRAKNASVIEYLSYEIAARIARFGVDRAKTLEALRIKLGEGVRPFFGKAWDTAVKVVKGETTKAPRKVKEAVETGATSPEKAPKAPESTDSLIGKGRAAVEAGDSIHNVVAKIVNGIIDSGNRDRADVFRRAHKIVQEFMPEATERDVRRAYVDYGKKTFPNPDEAAAFKRKTRQAAKIEEDIARIEKEKLRPELQGYQREKKDAELRRLTKERSELLKDPDLPPEPGAFASKDEAKQTRIKNRITELDAYLKGEKLVESKPPQPDSAATEQLRAEKEALEAYVKEVDAAKNPPLSEAQKALDSAMIARERAGHVLDDLSAGKLKDPAKVKEALTQLEEDVRLETDALKALAAEMRRDAKPKGDPGYMKEQAQIKALERAIESYASKVAKGDLASKGKVQGPDSRRVAALKGIRDSRRAAYKSARDAGKPVMTPEQRYNATRLKALERREAELKERGSRQLAGDFSKKPKPVPPALERKVLDKKSAVKSLQDAVDMRQKNHDRSLRPTYQKVLSAIGEVRGIVLGGDIGVLTRQGTFSWARPQHTVISAFKAFQAARSPKAMGRWEVEMREMEVNGKPLAPVIKEAGLQTTDTMSHPEELVISRVLSRMPDVKIGGKTVRLSVAARGLERFQTTFINDARIRVFAAGVKAGLSPKELKLRANFINSATGRSNAKYVPELLAAIMTSPRYERSRWEMLAQPFRNIGVLARDGIKGELNRGALANLQDMAVTAAGVVTLFGLAASWGGYKVNWNPESSDFLKMRKGNDVWDVSAGLAPRIRDLVRLWVGFNHPDYKENWMKTVAKMLFRTANPAWKTPLEQISIAKQRYVDGVDNPKSPFTGFKSEEEKEGFITMLPLIVQSMKRAFSEDGAGASVWAGAREFIGSSVSRYQESEE